MNAKEVTIRRYKLEDAEDLANIYYNTIHRINSKHYTQEQVDAWAPETSLNAKRWAEKFERTQPFVAVADESIVGFAEFEPDGHIDCFYCHHDWIGKGVGSKLMQAIEELARTQGIKRIFSEVSITAKPFFERCGFHVLVQQTVVMRGIELTNYKMEKSCI
jgi:putative acetyltransferase